MEDQARVLVATADAVIAASVRRTLEDAGHSVSVVTDLTAAAREALAGRYDVVVAGLGMAGADGIGVVRAARQASPPKQVIAVTPSSSPHEAVVAMKEGALYYLQAPVRAAELAMFVGRAAQQMSLALDRVPQALDHTPDGGYDSIVGTSQPMQEVYRKIEQVAPTTATVLIRGETGTGKELVARAIHYNSDRRGARFVPLNCAGLVETILESELFGHEKGAFTGAVSTRIGLFEYADGGTLFLDEIGDMPVSSQTKLLRVLEHGEIVRVGSNEPVKVDVRLVAATHQNLREKMEDGSFRRDLFYRLNVMTITLPPLRSRQGDVPLLVDQFVAEFAQAYAKPVGAMKPSVRTAIYRYPWPGNVRELRNCIEHMVVSTVDEVLGEDDLPDYLVEEAGELADEASLASLAGQPLDEVERLHIARTLELVEGNRERAAELLGIGERTLYRKIEKYGLR